MSFIMIQVMNEIEQQLTINCALVKTFAAKLHTKRKSPSYGALRAENECIGLQIFSRE